MTAVKPVRIGVLGLQGGVAEHLAALAALPGVEAETLLRADQLGGMDGVILPGGESTTIGKLLADFGLASPLRDLILSGLPVWGTCAGMILLAKGIENDARRHLAVMDIVVSRNAYGPQSESFAASGDISCIEGGPFPLVFIRAPRIVTVGSGVEPLAFHGGHIVACRERNMLATAFHPELTDDRRFHGFFVDAFVRPVRARRLSGADAVRAGA
ncbi:MAG: pyridoxal 5'-phosphate synthase glutaminase subunit PdxT [Spirochaetes bacterium]|nr:pyridoxal 5'-phosphate synthase glutaminase subunit PdxT [Spirochaetota bacterium]